jgi:ankyrin repeat protein
MAAKVGHTAVVKVLPDAQANINSADDQGRTPVEYAATNGHMQVVLLLLGAPQLATEAIAGAAAAAASAGHAELAIAVLKALMSRDMPAAVAALAGQPLADAVLRQWEAAEGK